MTIKEHVIKEIVMRVIKSQDYRIEIVNLINAEFLQFAIDFFKKIVTAKLNAQTITIEWYKQAFMSRNLSSDEIAINSGLNKKTISNMYRSATKQIVIEASNEHFETLYQSIQTLVENEQDVDLVLTIKFQGVSVDLNVSESLIVINTLAVKRAALRGGLWSTAGKRAEKYIMLSLCHMYKVAPKYYNAEHFIKNKSLLVDREIDFYLNNGIKDFKCEVKLMGQGNPESADAIIARDSDVFIADTLSQQNKDQCDQLGVEWVACRDKNGYKKFGEILTRLGIPNEEYKGDLNIDLPIILDSLSVK